MHIQQHLVKAFTKYLNEGMNLEDLWQDLCAKIKNTIKSEEQQALAYRQYAVAIIVAYMQENANANGLKKLKDLEANGIFGLFQPMLPSLGVSDDSQLSETLRQVLFAEMLSLCLERANGKINHNLEPRERTVEDGVLVEFLLNAYKFDLATGKNIEDTLQEVYQTLTAYGALDKITAKELKQNLKDFAIKLILDHINIAADIDEDGLRKILKIKGLGVFNEFEYVLEPLGIVAADFSFEEKNMLQEELAKNELIAFERKHFKKIRTSKWVKASKSFDENLTHDQTGVWITPKIKAVEWALANKILEDLQRKKNPNENYTIKISRKSHEGLNRSFYFTHIKQADGTFKDTFVALTRGSRPVTLGDGVLGVGGFGIAKIGITQDGSKYLYKVSDATGNEYDITPEERAELNSIIGCVSTNISGRWSFIDSPIETKTIELKPLYDGMELRDVLLHDKIKLTEKQRLQIMIKVAEDLKNRFHANHFLHRDIKPENIIVNIDRYGNVQSASLIDEGLAVRMRETSVVDDENNVVGTVFAKSARAVGTLPYMRAEGEKQRIYTEHDDILALMLMIGSVDQIVPRQSKNGYIHEQSDYDAFINKCYDPNLSNETPPFSRSPFSSSTSSTLVEIENGHKISLEEIINLLHDRLEIVSKDSKALKMNRTDAPIAMSIPGLSEMSSDVSTDISGTNSSGTMTDSELNLFPNTNISDPMTFSFNSSKASSTSLADTKRDAPVLNDLPYLVENMAKYHKWRDLDVEYIKNKSETIILEIKQQIPIGNDIDYDFKLKQAFLDALELVLTQPQNYPNAKQPFQKAECIKIETISKMTEIMAVGPHKRM